MPSYVNGRADLAGPPIILGDFLPEQRKVFLNGQEYLAWVTTNRRYPRRIMAGLDAATRRYTQVIAPLLAAEPDYKNLLPGEMEDLQSLRESAAEEQQSAYNTYITECISLLVQSLSESEADLIPLDDAEDLLRGLGFFRPKEAPREDPVQEVTDEPNLPLTGGTSRRGSRTSTQDIQTSTS